MKSGVTPMRRLHEIVFNGFVQEVRYGAGALRHSPGFTLAALAMLSLGIGLNVMMFTV